MADTTSFDTIATRLASRLSELQTDRTALVAVTNPDQSVLDAIAIIDKQIINVNNRISNNLTSKQSAIDKYNAQEARKTNLHGKYDSCVCNIVEKYT